MEGMVLYVRKMISLLVLSWALPVSAASTDAPVEWLDKMLSAFKSENYQGLFVYETLSGLLTLKVTHGVFDGQEKERLVYLDGPEREIIIDGKKIAYIRHRQEGVTLKSGYLAALSGRFNTDVQTINDFYQLRFVGDDRVARRMSRHIELLPRDNHRYGYHLWIDHDTGLLLKSEMNGDRGSILERFQFVELSVGSPLVESEVIPAGKHQWIEPATMNNSAVTTALTWEVGWVPDGFNRKGYRETVSPVSQKSVDSVLYSDGLAAFSLFVEEAMTQVVSQASEKTGATTAVSAVVKNGDIYYSVAVIGDIPLATAELIAVSVKPHQISPSALKPKKEAVPDV